MWHVHTVEHFLAIQKNCIMSFTRKWMRLGTAIVSEIRLRKRSPTYLSICNLCRKREIKHKGDRREDDQWEVEVEGDVLGLGTINVHDVHTNTSVKPLHNQCVVVSKKKVPLCSHIWGMVPEAMLALYLIGPRKVSVHLIWAPGKEL